jgi:hypothetical protein
MTQPLNKRDQVREVADSQHGLVTSAQLAELGVDTKTTSRRSLGGMWTRVLPGVHLVDGGRPSRTQREAAALLYAGEGSVLTGTTALRHHGLRAMRLQETASDDPERPEPVHVLIEHGRRRLSTGYVRVERTTRPPHDSVVVRGLRLAPIPRAAGDALRRLRNGADANALVAELVQRKLADIVDLETELRDGSRRGSGLFRDALALVARGARSGAEGDLMMLLESAGIPNVYYNVRLTTESGEFIAIADAWLDDVGVAIEVDSAAYHSGEEGFARTVRRNARYAAAGVTALTVLPTDLRRRRNSFLQQVRRARTAAAQRPRPRVLMTVEDRPSAGREGWRWGA